MIGLLAVVAVIKRDEIGDQLQRGDAAAAPRGHHPPAGREKDVPADLIAAVIYAESRFRDQESHAGARGLMQVTPQTAELIEGLSGGSTFVADDLSDPDINIRYGTFYLRYLLDKFDGNVTAALAAYNARRDQRRGMGRIRPRARMTSSSGRRATTSRACSTSATSTATTTRTSSACRY